MRNVDKEKFNDALEVVERQTKMLCEPLNILDKHQIEFFIEFMALAQKHGLLKSKLN